MCLQKNISYSQAKTFQDNGTASQSHFIFYSQILLKRITYVFTENISYYVVDKIN